jgi:putative FmdB family regulatory protein
MPIYEFTCPDCGLRFERLMRMADNGQEQECPDCGTLSPKVPSVTNHTFAHTPQGGPRPQNTGVHQIDYNFDRVIGRDSEEKWKVCADRQAHKRQVLRDNPGTTGHDLSRTHDGSYKVMKPDERRTSELGRAIHKKALDSGATKPPG